MILDPDVYQKAADDTAASMTMELRGNALKAGWHKEVVDNLQVKHSDGSFSVHVHPDFKDRAFVHEYGDEKSKGTAVIRRYNKPESGDKAFMKALKVHADGKKS
jgi:hypothetical protein